MRRIINIFIIIIVLLTTSSCNACSSCSNSGKEFSSDDLEGFLESLEKRNFTVEYTYKLYNAGVCLYDVKTIFKINNQTIYHEVFFSYSGTNDVVITTKKYIHYENGTYNKYLYQKDTTENPDVMYITKTTTSEANFNNEVKYGIDFIFNPIAKMYNYNEVNKEYEYNNTIITIDGSIIYISNPDGNLMTGNKNFKATYSLIENTTIEKPDFVKNYKKDIYQ